MVWNQLMITGRAGVGPLVMDEDSTIELWRESAGEAPIQCLTTRLYERGSSGNLDWCDSTLECRCDNWSLITALCSVLAISHRGSDRWRDSQRHDPESGTRAGTMAPLCPSRR